MTYEEFVGEEHAKRVQHLLDYCVAEGREPDVDDAVEIFGFTADQAQEIVNDAQEQFDILMGRWIG